MPSLYNDFLINNINEGEPWDEIEVAFHQDLINTVTVGTCHGGKRETGHRHYDMYNPGGSVAVAVSDANNDISFAGSLFLLSNELLLLGNTKTAPYGTIEFDAVGDPNALIIWAKKQYSDLKLVCAENGKLILDTGDSSQTGIKIVGTDINGTAWDAASSNKYRIALLDNAGNLVVGSVDVDITVS